MNVISAMICKLIRAGQTARQLVNYVAEKSIGLRADLGFGTIRMRHSMLSWAVHVLRAHRDTCPRASEVRHVIFSAEKGMARRAAFRSLHAVFEDWRNTYAPGMPWVAALQKHNGVYHLHVAIGNINSSGRALDFKPHMVVAMSEMEFTEHAVSAKGKGKRGLKIYTKARNKLKVEDLAELLALPGGGINAAVWQQLMDKGLVGDFNTRKDGTIVSFVYEKRRMRMRTLEGFIARLPSASSSSGSSSGGSSATPKKRGKAVPGGLSDKLKAAGYTSKDMASLRTNLRSTKALPRKVANTKNKTKNTPRK